MVWEWEGGFRAWAGEARGLPQTSVALGTMCSIEQGYVTDHSCPAWARLDLSETRRCNCAKALRFGGLSLTAA